MNKDNKKGNDFSCCLVSYNFQMLEVMGDEEARDGCRDLNKKRKMFLEEICRTYICVQLASK